MRESREKILLISEKFNDFEDLNVVSAQKVQQIIMEQ
jgi:hypothetical protein